jgi:small subunit ribosomal protein S18b, mitochondrial
MSFFAKFNFTNLLKVSNYQLYSNVIARNISASSIRYCEEHAKEAPKPDEKAEDPSIDRTKIIPVETSIRYLKSAAYKETYGEIPVWVPYRRNHKGALPPRKTRRTCIRQGKISTGNPCPICRDEYLVLHHDNTSLLNQFISPQTGKVSSIFLFLIYYFKNRY